eukprot:13480869-Heterocapsa_arctica.AAC.1
MIRGKRPIRSATFLSVVMVQGGAKPMTNFGRYGLTKDKLFKNKRGDEMKDVPDALCRVFGETALPSDAA